MRLQLGFVKLKGRREDSQRAGVRNRNKPWKTRKGTIKFTAIDIHYIIKIKNRHSLLFSG